MYAVSSSCGAARLRLAFTNVRSASAKLREYASAAAAPAASASLASKATPSSGIKTLVKDEGSASSMLAVVAKAGSKYQPKPGVAHLLEKFAFTNTRERSAFRITREAELLGGLLSSRLTREHIIIETRFLRSELPYFVELLAQVVRDTRFTQHEFNEVVLPGAKGEYASSMASAEEVARDLVNQQAFRRGLGDHLLIVPSSPVSVEDVRQYAQQAYSKDNIALVGCGVSETELQALTSELFVDLPSGPAPTPLATKYYGGETRMALGGSDSAYFVAFPGASASSSSAELAVLAQLLGGEQLVKWCSGVSPFSQVSSAFPGHTISIEAKNIEYADTGLFAIEVHGRSNSVNDAIKAAIKVFREVATGKVKIEEKDLKRAISQAKYHAFQTIDDRFVDADYAGRIALAGAQIPKHQDIASRLDKVTLKQLKDQAAKLWEARPSVSVVGATHTLPYYDEI